jgi:uncharacterized protein (DUF2235 family)
MAAPGFATKAGAKIAELAGLAFGYGLKHDIGDAYVFICRNFQPQDNLYLFGFSRGAYTARSLVGMVRNCGLIHPKHLALRVMMAYGIYRTRDDNADSFTAKLFRSSFCREVKIKFIGVWDTVGALGVPFDVLKDVNMKFYDFHDTNLSGIVENAYNAMAVDEHREDYDVCRWSPAEKPQQNLEQRWFIGAHCDVGGGYSDRRLSDLALRWIQDKASALGLALDAVAVDAKNYLGAYTDSYAEFLKGIYAKRNARHYRPICAAKFGNEVVDPSVQQRRKEDRDYEPQNDGLPKLG